MQRTPAPEPRPLLSPRGWIAVAVVGAVLVGYGLFLWSRPHTFAGSLLEPPRPAASFSSLTLHTGESADLARFSGDVIVVSFGYTNCPDICPRTLEMLAEAMDELGDRAAGVQVMMLGIDPERDTRQDLGRYVTRFHPRFLGVHGSAAEIGAIVSAYGVYVRRIPTGSGYVFEQSPTLVVVGPSGASRLLYTEEVEASLLAGDIEELMP